MTVVEHEPAERDAPGRAAVSSARSPSRLQTNSLSEYHCPAVQAHSTNWTAVSDHKKETFECEDYKEFSLQIDPLKLGHLK